MYFVSMMSEQLLQCVCNAGPSGKFNLVLSHCLRGLAPWCLSSQGSVLLIALKELHRFLR